MNSKLYDILKDIALVWLPALGTLYAGLAQFWTVPSTTGVVGTIVLIDTFLGAVLKISSSTYKPDLTQLVQKHDIPAVGKLEIDTSAGDPKFKLVLHKMLEELPNLAAHVVLNVGPPDQTPAGSSHVNLR